MIVVLAVGLSRIAGLNGVLVVFAAVFLKAADRKTAALPARLLDLLGFAVVLMAVATIGRLAADEMWPAVAALFGVTLVGGLAAAWGPHRAMQGFLASTFLLLTGPVVVSTTLTDAVLDVPLGAGLAVVVTAAVAVARVAAGHRAVHRHASAEGAGAPARPTDGGARGPVADNRSEGGRPGSDAVPESEAAADPTPVRRPSVAVLSVGKAVAVGLATLTGWFVTGGHPFWAAFAPLMIVRPDVSETASRGVRRIVGTVLGALLGWLLVRLIGDTTILALLLIPIAFLWFASYRVDYAVFVFFMTAFMIVLAGLGGGPIDTLPLERIIATAAGVAIAFVVVFVQFRFFTPRRRSSRPGGSPRPEG